MATVRKKATKAKKQIKGRAKTTKQAAKGRVQKAAGKATGSRKTQAKGTANTAVAKVKRAGQKLRKKLS